MSGDGAEEAEVEQGHEENEKRDEHGGPSRAEQRITAGGRGLFEQRIPAQRLRTAPHVSAFHRNRMAT